MSAHRTGNRGGGTEFRAHVGDGGAVGNGQGRYTGTGVFKDLAHAALDGQAPQQFKDDVLARCPASEFSGQVDLDHLGHGDEVGLARHGQCHGQTARTHGHGADAACGGGMGVGPDQGCARFGEIFKMELMTDAGACRGKHCAGFGGHGTEIAVVVRVAETHLKGVVVNVADRQVCADLADADGFELEPCHGAGGVLCQCLVDAQTDFFSGDHLAADEVFLNDLVGDALSHLPLLRAKLLSGYSLCQSS